MEAAETAWVNAPLLSLRPFISDEMVNSAAINWERRLCSSSCLLLRRCQWAREGSLLPDLLKPSHRRTVRPLARLLPNRISIQYETILSLLGCFSSEAKEGECHAHACPHTQISLSIEAPESVCLSSLGSLGANDLPAWVHGQRHRESAVEGNYVPSSGQYKEKNSALPCAKHHQFSLACFSICTVGSSTRAEKEDHVSLVYVCLCRCRWLHFCSFIYLYCCRVFLWAAL